MSGWSAVKYLRSARCRLRDILQTSWPAVIKLLTLAWHSRKRKVSSSATVRIFDAGRIDAGRNVVFKSRSLVEAEDGAISIGASTEVAPGAIILLHNFISTGDGALMGEYVTARDQDHASQGNSVFYLD